jgi:hypothetical protein
MDAGAEEGVRKRGHQEEQGDEQTVQEVEQKKKKKKSGKSRNWTLQDSRERRGDAGSQEDQPC